MFDELVLFCNVILKLAESKIGKRDVLSKISDSEIYRGRCLYRLYDDINVFNAEMDAAEE